MCDYTVDSDIGTGNIWLALGILHVCGHAHVRSHVSPGMDCFPINHFLINKKTCTVSHEASRKVKADTSCDSSAVDHAQKKFMQKHQFAYVPLST